MRRLTLRDWIEEIQSLPHGQISVEHEPPTERYARAAQKLRYVLREGSVLGTRQENEEGNLLELALWAPSASGRDCGFYTGWRIGLHEENAVLAVMFAFYNGKDSSICLKSVHAAKDFAKSNDFEVIK